MNKSVSINDIPEGDYCYKWLETPSSDNMYRGKIKCCPYWEMIEFSEGHEYTGDEYGYCHFMESGDDDDFGGLLFDQVKECGINEWPDEDFLD